MKAKIAIQYLFDIKKTKRVMFVTLMYGLYYKKLYICTVFFMVLDLRLTMKYGCRETTILTL